MTAIRHRTTPLVVQPRTASTTARRHATSPPPVVDPAPIHRSIFWGVVWMVLAGLATGLTSVVVDGPAAGGFYVLWWGPLVYGASMVILGLRDLRTIREGSVPERFLP